MMILLLLLSTSALAAPSWTESLPKCEDLATNQDRQRIERQELAQLDQKRPKHLEFSEGNLEISKAAQTEALAEFQRLRFNVCQEKQRLGEAYRAALAALSESGGPGADNCTLLGLQSQVDAKGREFTTTIQALLETKNKEWTKFLGSSFLKNRTDLEKFSNASPSEMNALKRELSSLWVSRNNQSSSAEPSAFFVRLSGFLARESSETNRLKTELGQRSLLMQQNRLRCNSLQGSSRSSQNGPQSSLGMKAESEAARCRERAAFLGGGNVCPPPKEISQSTGNCYAAVKSALANDGLISPFQLRGAGAINAHTFGRNGGLEGAGFTNVIGQGYSAYNAPEGAVLVYSSNPETTGHSYGHIEIHTRGRNCSDYCSYGPPGPPSRFQLVGVYIRQAAP